MKFGILVLTRREQRAVILIALALLAATIATHYRDQQIISTGSTSAESGATSPSSSEDAEVEDDESH